MTDGAAASWSAPRNFLTIAPALPPLVPTATPRLTARSLSSVTPLVSPEGPMAPHEVVFLNTTPEGRIQASRSQKEKEKNPDRICLDR